MFGLADVYNFTGKQAKNFVKDLIKLFDALEVISKIKARFRIEGDASQAIAVLEATYDAILASFAAQGGGKNIKGARQLADLRSAISALKGANNAIASVGSSFRGASGRSTNRGGGGGGSSKQGKDYGELDLPEELSGLPNRDSLIKQAIRNARALQKTIPGASKEAKNDVVSILDGMKKLETVRGVREDLLRRALEDLANIEKKRLEMESKADTIRRIRVGGGDFSAIANVPVNSKTGVSVGGPEGPINVTLNLNGQVMTPAQFEQFANMVAAALKRQLAK
jgi:hypothetical protein